MTDPKLRGFTEEGSYNSLEREWSSKLPPSGHLKRSKSPKPSTPIKSNSADHLLSENNSPITSGSTNSLSKHQNPFKQFISSLTHSKKEFNKDGVQNGYSNDQEVKGGTTAFRSLPRASLKNKDQNVDICNHNSKQNNCSLSEIQSKNFKKDTENQDRTKLKLTSLSTLPDTLQTPPVYPRSPLQSPTSSINSNSFKFSSPFSLRRSFNHPLSPEVSKSKFQLFNKYASLDKKNIHRKVC